MRSHLVGSFITLAILLLSTQLVLATAPNLETVSEFTNTSHINAMVIHGETLLAATDGGLAIINTHTMRQTGTLTSQDGLFGNRLNDIIQTGQNRFLVAGDFGWAQVTLSSNGQKVTIQKNHPFSSDRFDPALAIIPGDPDRGDDARILRLQSGITSVAPEQSPLPPGMWHAAALVGHTLYAGAADGALVAVDANGTRPLLHLGRPIVQLRATTQGPLILAGTTAYRLRDEKLVPLLARGQPVSVTAIGRDRQTETIGCTDGALYRVEQQRLIFLGRLPGPITALVVHGSRVWAGAGHQGVWRLNLNTGHSSQVRRPNEICSNKVTSATRFHGQLVVGSFDEGACVKTNHGWRVLTQLPARYVHGVASDGALLWIATSNGLARYDRQLNPVPSTQTDPKQVRWFTASAVTALAEQPEGVLLGAPYGIVDVHRTGSTYTARFISHKRGAPKHLTSLAWSVRGIYASSETDGVVLIAPRRRDNQAYMDPIHLPESWVLQVAATKEGFAAATCQHGIAQVTPQRVSMTAVPQGLINRRTVQVAPFADGLFVATLAGLDYVAQTGKPSRPTLGPLPDPRGTALVSLESTLLLGTMSGTRLFKVGTAHH